MGFRPQTSPRRSAGQRFQKSQHEKAKAKAEKRRGKKEFLEEEKPTASLENSVEKTVSSLKRLGDQKFAISPFSEYFDDWLINLKEVLSEFEANPAVAPDEAFVKERSQIIENVGREFTEIKRGEAELNQAVKELADSNHLLVQIDEEYAAKTRELGPKRNSEIQRLTPNVQKLEEELERVKAVKTGFFSPMSKSAKAQRLAEVLKKLESAKAEIESAVQSFKVEQEKLHDAYEKTRQDITERVQRLEKEVEKMETDFSLEVRHRACEALVNAVKWLLERNVARSSGASS